MGFEFSYKSQESMLSLMTKISEFSGIDMLLAAGCIIIILLLSFIITPLGIIIFENNKKQRDKKNKKRLLTQILLQKEIEDEVEREIKIQEENKK